MFLKKLCISEVQKTMIQKLFSEIHEIKGT